MMPGAVETIQPTTRMQGMRWSRRDINKEKKTYDLHLCVCYTIVMDRRYENSGHSDIERGKHAPSVVMMNSYPTTCQEA